MASTSTRRFHVPLSHHDSGLSATGHLCDVVEGGGNGEEDEAAASLDNEDSAFYSIATDGYTFSTTISTCASPDWAMLASIGSMFPDPDDNSTAARSPLEAAEQNQASRTPDAKSLRARQALALLEEDSLARLYHRLETQRERLREAFPEPLTIPSDPPRWGARERQRQRERRADEDSLRVLAYWTARRERVWEHDIQGRACGAGAGAGAEAEAGGGGGGCSDAASLRRLEYWTERVGVARGARMGPRPWKHMQSRVCGVGKEGSW